MSSKIRCRNTANSIKRSSIILDSTNVLDLILNISWIMEDALDDGKIYAVYNLAHFIYVNQEADQRVNAVLKWALSKSAVRRSRQDIWRDKKSFHIPKYLLLLYLY